MVPTDPTALTSFLSHWNDFCWQIAVHFLPLGVKTFEIYNEPNIAGFMHDEQGNVAPASSYMQMLQGCYTTIHGVAAYVDAVNHTTYSQGLVVMSAGLAGLGCSHLLRTPDDCDQPPATWWKHSYDYSLDMKAYWIANSPAPHSNPPWDAFGIHPYNLQAGNPPDPNSAYNTLLETVPRIYSDVVSQFTPAVKMYATEYGWYTNPNASGGVSYADQATNLCNGMQWWLQHISTFAGPILIYSWADGAGSSPDFNYGVVKHDGTPKPANARIGTLIKNATC
jgi:hypothetical protein